MGTRDVAYGIEFSEGFIDEFLGYAGDTGGNCIIFPQFLSGSGNFGRASPEFFHSEASISSYRALPALSSSREPLLPIRHCVGPWLRFVFPRLRRSRRCLPRWRFCPEAVQPLHPRSRDPSGGFGERPSPHSQRGGRLLARQANAPCAPAANPSGARRAPAARGTRARRLILRAAFLEFDRSAVDSAPLRGFHVSSCAIHRLFAPR